ncbi:MAG TPA: alpha-amylase/4-alpha-glucanotransferase domain-containing protein, partial [Sulfuricurvum sp.]|nr:alpha-amylase/4-alpha-glucanotransferase domain-containing protein [Sulfuricurvum sp.]
RYESYGVKFLKGGIWKNFFVKYPESNRLHKRMIELSRAFHNGEGDFETSLYKLQTNDPLWHGVFGGLYLPNLRDNAYGYLIECENLRYGKKKALVSDCNELDGYLKFKSVTSKLISRFDSAIGGQLVELDVRDACFNYQNTLARRKEAYHSKLFDAPKEKTVSFEEGIDTIHHAHIEVNDTLRDTLIYDWYPKNSFIDHISDSGFDEGSFRHCNFREYGDFSNQPFESSMRKNRITFTRDGGIYGENKSNTRVEKSFTFGAEVIEFSLRLNSESNGDFVYVMEHNFHFSNYDSLIINGKSLSHSATIKETHKIEIIDDVLKKKITIHTDKPFTVHYFQLQTLSQSEQGFDLSVQGISIALCFGFNTTLEIDGTLEISRV